MLARTPVLAVLATLALGLAACGDARPVQVATGGGGGLCVACHGGTDNATGAPPVDTSGRSGTALPTVGAHTSHVQAGPVAGAFACSECHEPVTALDSPGHRNGTVDLPFGALARTGSLTPVFNGAASPPTCSSVYCHGATLGGGAGTVLAPQWTTVDGTQASCGKCHQLPPPGHPALAVGSDNTTCAACHDRTVLPTGLIDVAGGRHVNGQLDVAAGLPHPAGWLDTASTDFHAIQVNARGPSYCQTCHAFSPPARVTTVVCSTCHNGTFLPSLSSCIGCHGGTDNATGAPPRATWGNQADTVRVGAHTSHLEGTHGLANPVACNECHVVPADAFAAGHVDQPTATLTFGTLATSGGAVPLWTRTAPATCSATYCHGTTLPAGTGTPNRAPVWTTTDGSQISCGTACHGSPPPTGTNISGFPAHVWHVTAAAGPGLGCTVCHSNIPNSAGTAIATPALHVNGTVNAYRANTTTPVSGSWVCNDCH